MKHPPILALESSCDESAAAIIESGQLLAHQVYTQTIHADTGGVIPEKAARAHLKQIVPVVSQVLKLAGQTVQTLGAVAFTQGPGLIGGLLIAKGFAQGLAQAVQIPLIGVHHIQAHLWVNFLEKQNTPVFPFLGLVVSGGHTELLWVKGFDQIYLLGQTKDDAAGEAFDKIGKALGYPYPAGPQIDAAATRYLKRGRAVTYTFPQAKMGGYDFSFSGLKTALFYFLRDQLKADPELLSKERAHMACAIQRTIISMIISKTRLAIQNLKPKQLVVGGGVAANSGLRTALGQLAHQMDLPLLLPERKLCTDNAAMVAAVAAEAYVRGDFLDHDAAVKPRMPFPKFFNQAAS